MRLVRCSSPSTGMMLLQEQESPQALYSWYGTVPKKPVKIQSGSYLRSFSFFHSHQLLTFLDMLNADTEESSGFSAAKDQTRNQMEKKKVFLFFTFGHLFLFWCCPLNGTLYVALATVNQHGWVLTRLIILCISLSRWKMKIIMSYSKVCAPCTSLHCTIWTKKKNSITDFVISFPKSFISFFSILGIFFPFRILQIHKI